MSESIDNQNTKEVTPSVGVKRSISWASDVKPPREGGMRIGAKWVPLINKDSIQVDTNGDGDEEQDDESDGEEQANESDEAEVDVKSDGDGERGQSQSQQSQARATKAGANNTQQSQSRSFATASGLLSGAGLSPSHWGQQ